MANESKTAVQRWGELVAAEKDRLVKAGMSPERAFDEARRAAVRKFPEAHTAMLREVNVERPAALRQAGLA